MTANRTRTDDGIGGREPRRRGVGDVDDDDRGKPPSAAGTVAAVPRRGKARIRRLPAQRRRLPRTALQLLTYEEMVAKERREIEPEGESRRYCEGGSRGRSRMRWP